MQPHTQPLSARRSKLPNATSGSPVLIAGSSPHSASGSPNDPLSRWQSKDNPLSDNPQITERTAAAAAWNVHRLLDVAILRTVDSQKQLSCVPFVKVAYTVNSAPVSGGGTVVPPGAQSEEHVSEWMLLWSFCPLLRAEGPIAGDHSAVMDVVLEAASRICSTCCSFPASAEHILRCEEHCSSFLRSGPATVVSPRPMHSPAADSRVAHPNQVVEDVSGLGSNGQIQLAWMSLSPRGIREYYSASNRYPSVGNAAAQRFLRRAFDASMTRDIAPLELAAAAGVFAPPASNMHEVLSFLMALRSSSSAAAAAALENQEALGAVGADASPSRNSASWDGSPRFRAQSPQFPGSSIANAAPLIGGSLLQPAGSSQEGLHPPGATSHELLRRRVLELERACASHEHREMQLRSHNEALERSLQEARREVTRLQGEVTRSTQSLAHVAHALAESNTRIKAMEMHNDTPVLSPGPGSRPLRGSELSPIGTAVRVTARDPTGGHFYPPLPPAQHSPPTSSSTARLPIDVFYPSGSSSAGQEMQLQSLLSFPFGATEELSLPHGPAGGFHHQALLQQQHRALSRQ